ncbi:hypothetical protein [Xenorhabdus koppenhoeferi]|uniref:hypothetical protein n=1 Tax=Xenorhabdus koppenhoeferi TaxID=351659 RepID=UPI001160BE66|nr:hypothetical protein [Xenorhabdus koppenhoeferi]
MLWMILFCQSFTNIDFRCLSEGTPLWAVMKEMRETLSYRSSVERWLDEMVRPNNLRNDNECAG